MEYKDRAWMLRAIGVLLVGAGALAAGLGPAELFIFRWFRPGGRFHYEGFGFGSFMFANMAAQILGYYVIAAAFLPLGVGHLGLRRWVRPVALGLFGFWLILGLPLVLIIFAIAVGSKELPVAGAVAIGVGLLACYFVLPVVFIGFYRSRDVRRTLEAGEEKVHWLEGLPVPLLVLAMVYVFFAVMLHVAVLLNGIFPLFGRFVTGLTGAVLLDAVIWALVVLVWGTLRRRQWAWWGALGLLGPLAVSTMWTFWQMSYAGLLDLMAIPVGELDFLAGVPVEGWHLALFLGLPLVGTVGLLVWARRVWRV